MTTTQKRRPTILICDDDELYQQAVKHALKNHAECKSARNGDEALTIVTKQHVDILLLDIQMRSADEGLRFIPRLKEADPDITILMVSGITDFRTVNEALRLGATDYIPKDADPDTIGHSILRLLERRELLLRNEQQQFEQSNEQKKHALIGKSPAITNLTRVIERIRKSPANVLITGETGTGKEVVARQLRLSEQGALVPFVAVDSATIQSSMAESILFGHEKGAFTGAEKTTKGIFEEANGGIVYFDEIGNMPLEIQSKLLRILQEKEIIRLGSSRAIQLDFRVVAATNKDLEAMAKEGAFKFDLLQRLNVLPLQLAPLRERTEDIPLLVEHFCRKLSPTNSLCFTDDALSVLTRYPWPGNVRELQNIVAYVLAMSENAEIDVADLPPKIRDAATPVKQQNNNDKTRNFYDRVAEFEKQILAEEYDRLNGNVSRMALELGMDRSHLYTKLKEHELRIKKT
jgi:DNA-binding NtrC family response regulator